MNDVTRHNLQQFYLNNTAYNQTAYSQRDYASGYNSNSLEMNTPYYRTFQSDIPPLQQFQNLPQNYMSQQQPT